jgi:hypothetical protein
MAEDPARAEGRGGGRAEGRAEAKVVEKAEAKVVEKAEARPAEEAKVAAKEVEAAEREAAAMPKEIGREGQTHVTSRRFAVSVRLFILRSGRDGPVARGCWIILSLLFTCSSTYGVPLSYMKLSCVKT